jgi:hypothetical protein
VRIGLSVGLASASAYYNRTLAEKELEQGKESGRGRRR